MIQENRSFDHYFGTLRGVRGVGDPRAIKLLSGKSVWHQPDPSNPDGYVLPFHPGAPILGLQLLEDLAHDWTSTHAAWNEDKYDQWVPNKGTTRMAHLTRNDIPFHYALADAFTVCDAYHCSLLGPTDPNRYHMWTGWVGNDGSGGGPVIDNAEAVYGWSTYPERLESTGISWKVYQDPGDGLDAPDFWGWTDDADSGKATTHLIQPHSTVTQYYELRESFGWYDFTVQVDSDASFERQLAGHLETGSDSMTDPAIGTGVSQASVLA